MDLPADNHVGDGRYPFPPRVVLEIACRRQDPWCLAWALYEERRMVERKGGRWSEHFERHYSRLFTNSSSAKSTSTVRQSQHYIRAWQHWVVRLGFELEDLQPHSPVLLGTVASAGGAESREEAEALLARLSKPRGERPTRQEILRELRN